MADPQYPPLVIQPDDRSAITPYAQGILYRDLPKSERIELDDTMVLAIMDKMTKMP